MTVTAARNTACEPCLECTPNPQSPGSPPVCQVKTCPKINGGRKGNKPRAAKTRSLAKPPTPPPAMQNMLDATMENDGTAETLRPVRNRAGATIMARAGTRRCDDRCQYARGKICVCKCGGVNHGASYIA